MTVRIKAKKENNGLKKAETIWFIYHAFPRPTSDSITLKAWKSEF